MLRQICKMRRINKDLWNTKLNICRTGSCRVAAVQRVRCGADSLDAPTSSAVSRVRRAVPWTSSSWWWRYPASGVVWSRGRRARSLAPRRYDRTSDIGAPNVAIAPVLSVTGVCARDCEETLCAFFACCRVGRERGHGRVDVRRGKCRVCVLRHILSIPPSPVSLPLFSFFFLFSTLSVFHFF